MTSGVLINPDVKHVGGSLSADVPAGSTVLPLDDTGEFEETFEAGDYFLTVGEDLTPLRYISPTTNDEGAQQSVTLAWPTTVDYEAGLPVILWDPASENDDKRAIQYPAEVLLSDHDAEEPPIPVLVRHTLLPLSGVYSLEGAQVTITEDDDGQWWVDNVDGRSPVVTSDVISTPKALGLLNVDQPWPSAAFETIYNFGAFDLDGVTFDFTTGIWTFTKPGEWFIKLDLTFSANASGTRGGRVRVHLTDGTFEDAATVKTTPVEGTTAMQVIEQRYFFVGQGVSFLARQTSGADLTLLGTNGDLSVRPTGVKFVRIAT